MKKIALLLICFTVFLCAIACSQILTVTFETGEGSTVEGQTISRNSQIRRPIQPVREGYDFDGWYTTIDCQKQFDFKSSVKKNTTLYAGWRIKSYTISFVTEGTLVGSISAEYNSHPTLPLSVLSGYTFNGWLDEDGLPLTKMPASDVTLYASFTLGQDYAAFTFEKGVSGYTLTAVEDIIGEVAVPDTYANQSVDKIGRQAFKHAKNVTKLTVPDSVRAIEDAAFEGMTRLKTISLPRSVTAVSARQFYGCESLENVDLSNIESIGQSAFLGCTALKTVELSEQLASIGDRAFFSSGITSIAVPSGVTVLPTDVFFGCSDLSTVTLSGQTVIGDGAFEGCVSLKSIALPPTLTGLGARAFATSGITALTLPAGLENAGDYLFYACSDLSSVEFLGETVIGDYLFFGCHQLKSVSLPRGLTHLGMGTFENCQSLESIDLPDSVMSIGESAMRNCLSLKTVILPDVTHLAPSTFEGCTLLESVTLPDSLVSIGAQAFYGCGMLSQITLPDKVQTIGQRAFMGCGLIEAFDFSDNLLSVGRRAFEGTGWLNSQSGDVYAGKVFLKASEGFESLRSDTKSIADYAFSLSSIDSIILPDTLAHIGEFAFESCTKLTQVVIPANVSFLGMGAFSQCVKLESVTFNHQDQPIAIGKGALSGCKSLTAAHLPRFATVSQSMLSGCISLTELTLPTNITTIPDSMLSGCSSLRDITIPDSVTSIESYAFTGAVSLTSLTLSKNLVSIGTGAFLGAVKLNRISLPDKTQSVMALAFKDSGLSFVYIPESVTQIGEQAFFTNNALIAVIMGSPFITTGAFNSAQHLKLILSSEFYLSVKTESFVDPAYQSWMGFKASVYNMEGAQDGFVLEGGRLVAYIGEDSSITIPDAVTSITAYAFSQMDFLTDVTFNSGLKSIGERAFFKTGLRSISLGDSVTSIGSQAFYVDGYLLSIRIGVTESGFYTPSLGSEALKLAAYKTVEAGGISYYVFEGDSSIYDQDLKKVQPSEQIVSQILQDDAPFTVRIIALSSNRLELTFRRNWSEYSRYIYIE